MESCATKQTVTMQSQGLLEKAIRSAIPRCRHGKCRHGMPQIFWTPKSRWSLCGGIASTALRNVADAAAYLGHQTSGNPSLKHKMQNHWMRNSPPDSSTHHLNKGSQNPFKTGSGFCLSISRCLFLQQFHIQLGHFHRGQNMNFTREAQDTWKHP